MSIMKNCLFAILSALTLSCGGKQVKQVGCAFIEGLPNSKSIECGKIMVPENHDEPDGKQIELAYVILKAKNKKPNPYPLIYLTGGPGGATLMPGRIEGWMSHPILEKRDIIMFDQRGIGYSSGLPNMEKELFEIMSENASEIEEQAMMDKLIQTYKEKCEAKGIDLAFYNSFQNARDVGSLMSHLGYGKYNLYGVSYGTRLARIVQDMFPEQLNAVIHNSPSPLGGDFLVGRLNSYSLALNRIFEYCDNTPACKLKYPNLEEAYLEGIAKLENAPIKVEMKDGPFYVNAQDGLYLLRRRLYSNDSREAIPRLIEAYNNGGGKIIEEIIDSEFLFTGGYNSSMWLAVERYEQFNPEYTPERLEEVYADLPLFPAKLGIFNAMYNAGTSFHDASLPIEARIFQNSSVPSLITVNQYDPVTPPENGHLFKEKLPNGQLFILDEGGHGGGNPTCRAQVMIEFMDDPEGDLDTSCLKIYKGG